MFLALALTGCATVGPRSIRNARFNYNDAIVRTFDEQMLLNLVRLRYRDTPFFLEVANVTTEYQFAGNASLGSSVGDGDAPVDTGFGVNLAERPTIVYAPLSGGDFAKRFLSPISPETLFLLTRAGWRTDRVLRCGVVRINDVWNAPEASGPTPSRAPAFDDFREVATLLETLKRERRIDFVYQGTDDRGALILRFTGEASDERRRLTTLLGLDPERDAIPLRIRADLDDGLRVSTRSLLGVMYLLSQAVEVPERDRVEGRVTVTRGEDGAEYDWSDALGDLIRIRHSEDAPKRAAVRVRYRGAWFYIDDTDLESKSTFNLLGQLFNLQAGDVGANRPILTLPLGQ